MTLDRFQRCSAETRECCCTRALRYGTEECVLEGGEREMEVDVGHTRFRSISSAPSNLAW